MKNRAAEDGTFWVVDPGDKLPPICPARIAVSFHELAKADIPALAAAMKLPDTDLILKRLVNGRRCFMLQHEGQIITYGWVTHGVESVGELERQFNFRSDEAYIWHCGTVESWRGRRGYSALLSYMVHQLAQEDVYRIWIGASRQNRPSVKGFVNAGFQPVADVVYRRYYRLSFLAVSPDPTAKQTYINDAYRIFINRHERRIGRLVIGYKVTN